MTAQGPPHRGPGALGAALAIKNPGPRPESPPINRNLLISNECLWLPPPFSGRTPAPPRSSCTGWRSHPLRHAARPPANPPVRPPAARPPERMPVRPHRGKLVQGTASRSGVQLRAVPQHQISTSASTSDLAARSERCGNQWEVVCGRLGATVGGRGGGRRREVPTIMFLTTQKQHKD